VLNVPANYDVSLQANIDGNGAGCIMNKIRKKEKSEAEFVALITLYNKFCLFSFASETKYISLYRFWDAEQENGHEKA
jgi:hypothetical protein